MAAVNLQTFDQFINELFPEIQPDKRPATWVGRCEVCGAVKILRAESAIGLRTSSCDWGIAGVSMHQSGCHGVVYVLPRQDVLLAAHRLGGSSAVLEVLDEQV